MASDRGFAWLSLKKRGTEMYHLTTWPGKYILSQIGLNIQEISRITSGPVWDCLTRSKDG